jgi:hypothetical protein
MTTSSRTVPRGLQALLDVLLVLLVAWAGLTVLFLLGLAVNPMHPMRRFLNITTLYPLQVDRATIAALVTANAPPASVEIDLLAYVTFRPWSRWFVLCTALGSTVWWGLWITAVAELRWIADTLRRGKPFQVANVRRIRIAGWAVIGVAFFEPLWELATIGYIRSIVTLHGVGAFPPLAFVVESLPLGTLCAGVIVLALAEVFRLGTVLEDERALTI